MPLIDKVLPLIEGSDFYVSSNDLSELVVYSVQNGTVHKYASSVLMGSWQELDLTVEEFNLAQQDIIGIEGATFEDTDILILNKQDETRIIKMPETDVTYSPRSLYRLYWAYDTRKLYMNVADTWVTVGTMNHDLLDNVGTMSHEQLEEAISTIQEEIAGGVSTKIDSSEKGVANGVAQLNASGIVPSAQLPSYFDDDGMSYPIECIDGIAQLTSAKRQYILNTLLSSSITIKLPTTTEESYNIALILYSSVGLNLFFENNDIYWNTYPTIPAGRKGIIYFMFANNEWSAEYIQLVKFGTNYVVQKNITYGYIVQETNGALLVDSANWHNTTDFIPILSDSSYTITVNTLYNLRYTFYTSSKLYISGVMVAGATTYITILSPANATYIRFSADAYHGSPSSTWKFELGPIATGWVPAIEDSL